MKIINAIYSAPYKVDFHGRDIYVEIKYNNHLYIGSAHCHPEDLDFYSEKVGQTIALTRARIKILREEYYKISKLLTSKYNFYNEVTGHGEKSYREVDPTGAFCQNIKRTEFRQKVLQKSLTKEIKNLNNYLKGYVRVIESVKRQRNMDNSN